MFIVRAGNAWQSPSTIGRGERRRASEQSALFVRHTPGSGCGAEGRGRDMHPEKVLFHKLPELVSQTDGSVVCVFIHGRVGECVVDDN